MLNLEDFIKLLVCMLLLNYTIQKPLKGRCLYREVQLQIFQIQKFLNRDKKYWQPILSVSIH